MVRYVAIRLSSLQCVEGFLMTLKNFDYLCSFVFKQETGKELHIRLIICSLCYVYL